MFDHGFPSDWSTLKKLIWLKGVIAGGASAIWKTVTGALIHITDALASPVKELSVAIEPLQSGSGDPYPAGGGKNKLDESTIVLGSYNSSGGTTNDNDNRYRRVNISLAEGTYTFSTDLANCYIIRVLVNNSAVESGITGQSVTFTLTGTSTVKIAWRNTSTSAITETFHTQIEVGSSATAYAPYSNVRPITGWTGCDVWVKDEYDTSLPATASVTFPDGQTVYGGKYDFVSGNLKPYKEYDSYNGETLIGRWISSTDKYIAGTTPTIGAQVVDLDGFETTVQLTPQTISTLAGENNIWSDCGDIELTYLADGN